VIVSGICAKVADKCYLQLWDVASDQQAVDLVRDVQDPNSAAKKLMDHAFEEGTRDNVTILVVRLKKPGRT
jgi:protein phosphatase PTC1